MEETLVGENMAIGRLLPMLLPLAILDPGEVHYGPCLFLLLAKHRVDGAEDGLGQSRETWRAPERSLRY